MKKRLTLGILIFLIGILPLVFAPTDTNIVDDVFRINEIIDYKKPCLNNGTYCSSSSVCNYTIFNPDNSLLIDNQRATNNGAYHNLTFTTTEIGIHQVDMVCNDGNLNGAETMYFEITGSGFHNILWFYILILGVSFVTIIWGFNISDPTTVLLGSFGLYFVGIWTLLFGIADIRGMTTTWPFSLIILMLAGYISARTSHELIVG